MLDYHSDPFRVFVVISRRSSMLAFVVVFCNIRRIICLNRPCNHYSATFAAHYKPIYIY